MNEAGSSKRKDECLRSLVATSLYADETKVKMDQFIQFTPGLNDCLTSDFPGDDAVILFHSVKPPGRFSAFQRKKYI